VVPPNSFMSRFLEIACAGSSDVGDSIEARSSMMASQFALGHSGPWNV
jgi:hypothetical protein